MPNKALLVSIIFLWAVAGLTASAQQASYSVWVDWRADTYVPSDYAGRALPAPGSFLEATVLVAEIDGKLADISRLPIYWYLNDRFLDGGDGKQKVVFLVPEDAGRNLKLRARVGGLKNGDAIQTVRIPVAAPDVVIDAPYPKSRFSASSAQAWARAYYFSINKPGDLGLTWRVNGQVVQNSEHPESLRLDIGPDTPDGTLLNISLAARNPRKQYETAQTATQLIFQK